jgi:hypothetical protein
LPEDGTYSLVFDPDAAVTGTAKLALSEP